MSYGAHSKATWELPDRPPQKLEVKNEPRHTMIDSRGFWIYFHVPVKVAVSEYSNKGWTCEVPFLNVNQGGRNRQAAMAAAADAIRAETYTLLHTMSHTLNREQLVRKGLLLGAVDVLKSKIAKSIGEFTWIWGRVERDEQGVAWFREMRTDGEVFPIDPLVSIPDDALTRMAKLRMDDFGDPMGAVIELEKPRSTDPDSTWQKWERLMSRDDE